MYAQDDPSAAVYSITDIDFRTRQLVLRSQIDEVQFQLEHEDQLAEVKR